MKSFFDSPTYQIVKAMRMAGNQPGIVSQWKDSVETWAKMNPADKDARAVMEWLPHWQTRPFYTVTELAPLWPYLALALNIIDKPFPAMHPFRLERQLDFVGLPCLLDERKEVAMFEHPITHIKQKFYIVERQHYWKGKVLTQGEFNALFS